MYKFDNDLLKSEERSLLFSFAMFVTFLIGGLIIGSLIGFLLLLPFFEGDISNVQEMLGYPLEQMKEHSLALLIMQGGTAFTMFVVFPMLYLDNIEHKNWGHLNGKKTPKEIYQMAIFSIILALVIMPLTSTLMEWNQNVVFPEFLKGLEHWFQAKEEQAKVMTQAITTFHSTGELIVGIIVIAGIAAVGEELVFRGILQNLIWKGTNNIHIAIWLTGFIFSAIHIQFYGLIPRMMLGVLFGYYYYWSRNIWIPIIAHFFNNALTIILFHLHNIGIIQTDIESQEHMPLQLIVFSVVLSIIILYYYDKMASNLDNNE